MTNYEYRTFVLGQCPTLPGKYLKAKADLEQFTRSGQVTEAEIVTAIIAEYEKTYSADELAFKSDAEEEDYWVELLAKRSAVELLVQGKVMPDTMSAMSCLPDTAFVSCVKKSAMLAGQMNNVVQQVERSIQPEDLVPQHLM